MVLLVVHLKSLDEALVLLVVVLEAYLDSHLDLHYADQGRDQGHCVAYLAGRACEQEMVMESDVVMVVLHEKVQKEQPWDCSFDHHLDRLA